ncbi:2-oxoglutarate ferredoxin oxidoreductase subunit delta [Thermodesulfovibrio aggregans]|uniref:2-oxoglutarate ferredoxin oxidoreductase subunit delta n=1 Tax=Thermodesulfovibrio aggregans TaxID=86166 RepID=A0A0U9HPM6_9BACT|nr:ferredoxin family protein [Thermodesulfovibrio aggregans]GAQ95027.1 2-oxoglutarate ferredoxin oxidoreductase subunit delta [Thermodesulfovibrio aggregans]
MQTKVKKGLIVIDSERCKGCKYCILTCPKGCIELSSEFNASGFFPARFSNPENCIGCAMCAVVCPEIAIEVFVED